MKYIIHGASGAQGSPLYKKLLAAGKNAVGAVRDTKSLNDLPAIAVDNSSVESLIAAYKGAEGVFVHLPLGPEEMRLEFAKNIGKAIMSAKPKRVIISTSGWTIDAPGTPLQYSDDNAVSVLKREVEKSGVSSAVIAPRFYLENLLLPMTLEAVKSKGVIQYPIRSDYAVSWGSHLDVADVAIELFNKPSVTGIVGVGQFPGITGKDLADSFSKYFGKKITFESLKPAEYGKLLVPLFGEIAAAGVEEIYNTIEKSKENVINRNTSAQNVLDFKPRSIEQWLSDMGIR
ncbi:SDR family oxidoreductase [Bdellovibrio sp. HCB-162]|uniref:SDR family oxidoreductase n=1 Tax=Bdellovibrio sp. HCB-162 TaxID=3394234 RepID=UPI0039BC6735